MSRSTHGRRAISGAVVSLLARETHLRNSVALLTLVFSWACSSTPQVNPGKNNTGDPDASVGSSAPGDGGLGTTSEGVISLPPGQTTAPSTCTKDAGCDDDYDPGYDAGPACGDGVKNEGEECDDGNSELGDGCSGACRIEPNFRCPDEGKPCESTIECGNGKIEVGEVCDDGNTKNGDGCSGDCSSRDPNYDCEPGETCVNLSICGDGVVYGEEACDDKEAPGGCNDECTAIEDGWQCLRAGEPCVQLPECGNGVIELGERCDDNNTNDGDGCDAQCQTEEGFLCLEEGGECLERVCGDGVLTPGEQCDDGNDDDGDGCVNCEFEPGWVCSARTGTCIPVCGDGLVIDPEECDFGDKAAGDGCSVGCTVEGLWECDDDGCTNTVECGDGVVEGRERCDDGNTNDGDGCSADCSVWDLNYDCSTPGANCVPLVVCGNGILEGVEECDDGNAANGCSDDCSEIEEGWICLRPGEPCTREPRCGDGIQTRGEQCDYATSTPGCVDCQIQAGWVCTSGGCVQEQCGDGNRTPSEQCDDGNDDDDDGCTDCTLDLGWVCPLQNTDCRPRCGDGIRTGNEQCDDGNRSSTDGCSAACTREAGYVCDTPGQQCVESVCGDGVVDPDEGCDDDNLIAGDGCGPTCQLEPTISGWPDPVVAVTCGDGIKTGDEQCDDGNIASGDGCSNVCEQEDGWLCTESATYPDDIEFKITYRDFKQRDLSGGHPHMKQDGVTAPTGYPSTANDFGIVGALCTAAQPNNCGRLDAQGKPTYVGTASGTHVTIDPNGDNLDVAYHQEAFRLWYRDVNRNSTDTGTVSDPTNSAPIAIAPNPGACTGGGGVCATAPATTMTDTLVLSKLTNVGNEAAASAYRFSSNSNTFYPLGSQATPARTNRGFGYTSAGGNTRNWHFTSELRYFFQYQGGEELAFFGDDDVWVFVNGRLAVDIGGIHTTVHGRVVLGDEDSDCTIPTGTGSYSGTAPAACTREPGEVNDDTDDRFQITKGGVYEIVVFQAERHPRDSNYQLTLTGFIAPRSTCAPECGDGKVTGGEVCDEGEDNLPEGSTEYERCIACNTFLFCGDGEQNGLEDCDNGINITEYQTGAPNECAPGCIDPPSCGDDELQPAHEACDNGNANNDNAYDGCTLTCDFGPYCGDGVVTAPETCDQGTNNGGYGKVCGYDCKPAPRCGDGVRNGPEECDLGDANEDAEYGGCGTDCKLNPNCGDNITQGNEECDDGVNVGGYGRCDDMCQNGPSCGDGQLDVGFELCDDGANNDNDLYDGCTDDCQPGPRCGDGIKNGPEECDNGVNIDFYMEDEDSCTPDCTIPPECGDGTRDPAFEECDRGDDNENGKYGGCSLTCELGPYCGDGEIDEDHGEACDEGLQNGGYGKKCGLDCQPAPRCGDGEKNGPEQCDLGEDKNTGEYGGCKADCTFAPRCGDGKRQADQGEQCDDGVNDGGYGECAPGCVIGPRCGDGQVQASEQCDDGVNDGGYGECARNCRLGARCGDGVIQADQGETCDDGNKTNGDGCSSTCRRENRPTPL